MKSYNRAKIKRKINVYRQKVIMQRNRKLYLCELNRKLTVLETHIKNENVICKTEMQKRSQIEQKLLQLERGWYSIT